MFSKIDEAMQRYVDDEILPGISYQILKGSEIVHTGQVGYADIESKTPLQDDAIYRICLLYTSPSPRDVEESRMPSSA